MHNEKGFNSVAASRKARHKGSDIPAQHILRMETHSHAFRPVSCCAEYDAGARACSTV